LLVLFGFFGDHELVVVAWCALVLTPFLVWTDYVAFVKLVRLDELEISTEGIRRVGHAARQRETCYEWQELDGPRSFAGRSGTFLEFVVKATGRTFVLAPSLFGTTADEMEALISAAQERRIVSPEQWRSEHPLHPFRQLLLEWGLPLLMAAGLSTWTYKLRH
jgi:hypothetical protein